MPGSLKRKTALITGASSGIGRGFAEAYARRGVDILAVARRETPLRQLASQLTTRYGIHVTTFPGDLSLPETPKRLLDFAAEQSIEVDILINNAGFGAPGNLCDVDWSQHRDCIEVMTTAPVRLCYLLAPLMVERGRGSIINVSSLSAVLPPHAGGTLYYPVKSFLYQFSLAFRAEMQPAGVRVLAVCPGFTETGFQKAAGGTVESVAVPKQFWTSPTEVAEVSIKAVEANHAICIPGLFNKATAVVFKLLPAALARRIVR